MAGKFGADFNASQPSDADLVKKGAQWIRDIKTRIKTTWGVCFNLETGQPLNNVIPSASLKSLNPDPSGTYREVDINEKGLVTGGRNPVVDVVAKPFSWAYFYTQGLGPDGLIISRSLVADGDGLNVASYTFVTPAGVSRLRVRVYGAGGGGGYNATPNTAGGGGGGGFTETLVDVDEGDAFLVWVGEGGIQMLAAGPTAGKKGAETKFERAPLEYAKAYGGLPGTATTRGTPGNGETTSSVSGWGPNFNLTGQWGTIYDGGLGGGGAGGAIGQGGMPASTGAGGNPGGAGLVVVEYWKN